MDSRDACAEAMGPLMAAPDPFRLFVEAVEDYAIFMLDPQGNVASWNAGAQRLKQYTADEIIGKHFSCFYLPNDVAAGVPAAELADALTKGRVAVEGWRQRKDGSLFRAAVVITPVYDGAGRHLGFGKVTRDVTHTVRAELVASVVENALDGIVSIDERGAIQSFNPAAERIFGYAERELLGCNINLLMPEPDHSAHDGYIARYLQSGQAHVIGIGREVTGRRRDGRTFPLELAVSEFDYEGRHFFTGVVRDISERRDREAWVTALLDNVSDAIITCDEAARIQSFNRAAETIFGYSESELRGQSVFELLDEARRVDLAETVGRLIRGAQGELRGIENIGLRKDGSVFPFDLSLSAFARGGQKYIIGVLRDATLRKAAEEERNKLEAQLRQSQKMEAVGRLAGGVAHDFNNMLTVINGYSQIVLGGLEPESDLYEPLSEILQAGERAALITQQLLAFSRQQVMTPRVLNLNSIVADTEKMLLRLIGEDISIQTTLDPTLHLIYVDQGQIVQVLMNLAVNARDAMPSGGRLTIKTSNFYSDRERVLAMPEYVEGPYVLLSISDNGCGMPPEVRSRIFEPFFTTKEQGRGTGLGLATVFGIVKQSGGNIEVYSEPDLGTTFRIYLPAHVEAGAVSAQQESLAPQARGDETILLVEDEAAVRTIALHVLEALGYTVLAAAGPEEALQLSAEHAGRIDLLLTDVVMPEMNGRELADEIYRQRPETKALFMSGYTDDAVFRHGLLYRDVAFMQKPFTPAGLAQRVRSVLDEPLR